MWVVLEMKDSKNEMQTEMEFKKELLAVCLKLSILSSEQPRIFPPCYKQVEENEILSLNEINYLRNIHPKP